MTPPPDFALLSQVRALIGLCVGYRRDRDHWRLTALALFDMLHAATIDEKYLRVLEDLQKEREAFMEQVIKRDTAAAVR